MFQIGDTVRLKSGGPIMTIVDIEKNDGYPAYCTCAWFLDGVPQTASFIEAALIKVNL
ncbi:DUF2158 domain-containing protein [Ignatzschineria indica]|uniref:YodC family protein n=1 Tax=Ignatzschineria indica TaxID=472583 RepID=UPI0025773876|nr:DUF2158 domain-containing protein [Ignatzschineria indica]MDM1545515.1 DUF2158 domain-containing protein [Ignatzschineria indica]